MITGYKPSGYFETSTGEGYRIEGETRQCVHCQYTWEYRPGSGETRGFCLHCHGLVCGRAECAAEQRRLIASFPDRSFSCMPLEQWNERRRDQYDKDPRYEVTSSGIVIARA